MLLAWDGKISLETKEARGVANEIDMKLTKSGKIAINRSLVISTRFLFSILPYRLKRENQSRWDDQR